MAELKDKNKSMKDELFRLSQRYSRRMSMVRRADPFFRPYPYDFDCTEGRRQHHHFRDP